MGCNGGCSLGGGGGKVMRNGLVILPEIDLNLDYQVKCKGGGGGNGGGGDMVIRNKLVLPEVDLRVNCEMRRP